MPYFSFLLSMGGFSGSRQLGGYAVAHGFDLLAIFLAEHLLQECLGRTLWLAFSVHVLIAPNRILAIVDILQAWLNTVD